MSTIQQKSRIRSWCTMSGDLAVSQQLYFFHYGHIFANWLHMHFLRSQFVFYCYVLHNGVLSCLLAIVDSLAFHFTNRNFFLSSLSIEGKKWVNNMAVEIGSSCLLGLWTIIHFTTCRRRKPNYLRGIFVIEQPLACRTRLHGICKFFGTKGGCRQWAQPAKTL